MKQPLLLWDFAWKQADDPEQDKQETGVPRHQIRYFLKTATPLGKFIRSMSDGDNLTYVNQEGLYSLTVKCYAAH